MNKLKIIIKKLINIFKFIREKLINIFKFIREKLINIKIKWDSRDKKLNKFVDYIKFKWIIYTKQKLKTVKNNNYLYIPENYYLKGQINVDLHTNIEYPANIELYISYRVYQLDIIQEIVINNDEELKNHINVILIRDFKEKMLLDKHFYLKIKIFINKTNVLYF